MPNDDRLDEQAQADVGVYNYLAMDPPVDCTGLQSQQGFVRGRPGQLRCCDASHHA
jgi:hypothetical protein